MKKFIVAAMLATMFAFPAIALDLTKTITTLDGQPITADGKPDSKPVPLSKLITDALLASYADEGNLPGSEKLIRFNLALKINDNKDVNLSTADIQLIEKMVAKLYSPLIYGRIFQALEPPASNEKKQ